MIIGLDITLPRFVLDSWMGHVLASVSSIDVFLSIKFGREKCQVLLYGISCHNHLTIDTE